MSLTEKNYRNRIAERAVASMLGAFGAVCIEGPKWCGKTWLGLNRAESVVYVGDPAGNFQNRRLAQMDPLLILEGSRPRLIDEWQEVPGIWDAVRFACDRTVGKGLYILTGTSTPQLKGFMHGGTGRIGKLRLRTMSLLESGDSEGTVSLGDIVEKNLPTTPCSPATLRQLATLIVRGGWPGLIGSSEDEAQAVLRSYIENIPTDIERMDGKARNSEKVQMLVRSLARNESTLASKATLRKDIFDSDNASIDDNTISDYLNSLDRLFLVDNQLAFNPNMRSSARVGKSVKRHLADPSLAAAALGASTERLIADLNTFGLLFEALCERDLAIYGAAIGASLRHYRDAAGREADAVLEFNDGSWAAFEIKLGADSVDEGAASLRRLRDYIKKDPKAREPKALCVISGLCNAAYTRPDGVMVAPITSLTA